MFSFSLDKYLGGELLGQTVEEPLKFLKGLRVHAQLRRHKTDTTTHSSLAGVFFASPVEAQLSVINSCCIYPLPSKKVCEYWGSQLWDAWVVGSGGVQFPVACSMVPGGSSNSSCCNSGS